MREKRKAACACAELASSSSSSTQTQPHVLFSHTDCCSQSVARRVSSALLLQLSHPFFVLIFSYSLLSPIIFFTSRSIFTPKIHKLTLTLIILIISIGTVSPVSPPHTTHQTVREKRETKSVAAHSLESVITSVFIKLLMSEATARP